LKRYAYFNQAQFSQLPMKSIIAGIVSGFLAITGASLLILEAANNGGYSSDITLSWVFSAYFFGGVYSLLFSFKHKMPLPGSHSLSAITYITTVSSLFTFNEMIASFFLTGLIFLILGISKSFNKFIEYLPIEIISAMLAGMILSTLFSLSSKFLDGILIVLLAFVGYFATAIFLKKVPNIFGALLFSIIGLMVSSSSVPFHRDVLQVSYFNFYKPEFSWEGVLVITIPLFILILSNDLLVGINELKKEGYQVNRSKSIPISGFFTMVGSFFGSHCTHLAGIMTTICASPENGNKSSRYIASIASGIVLLLFAFNAGLLIPLIQSLPKGFPAAITFLALYGVMIPSVKLSFSKKNLFWATIPTFLVSSLKIQIFIFNGPILGLILGLFIFSFIKIKDKQIINRSKSASS
jgi:benzoate membrane transport protein